MIIYGTEVKGPFYPEKLSTLPVYTASDEGRVVYVDGTGALLECP